MFFEKKHEDNNYSQILKIIVNAYILYIIISKFGYW